MRVDQIVVGTVVLTILVVTATSGAFTSSRTQHGANPSATFGHGSVEASVIVPPGDEVYLRKAQFGASTYVIETSDVTVHVEAVTGRPLLVYKLAVSELGYARSTIRFLRPRDRGTVTLSLERDTIDPSRVDAPSYRGELTVLVRNSTGQTVLYRDNVTVVVEQ